MIKNLYYSLCSFYILHILKFFLTHFHYDYLLLDITLVLGILVIFI